MVNPVCVCLCVAQLLERADTKATERAYMYFVYIAIAIILSECIVIEMDGKLWAFITYTLLHACIDFANLNFVIKCWEKMPSIAFLSTLYRILAAHNSCSFIYFDDFRPSLMCQLSAPIYLNRL